METFKNNESVESPHSSLNKLINQWIEKHGGNYPEGAVITIDATPDEGISIEIKDKSTETQ